MANLTTQQIGSSKNILVLQTVQIAPFRTLMTALKDILLETNISFTPEGIKIINMDKSHTILAHLCLYAKNFEHYECNEPKIVIGVNMFHLFKLINTIDNDDTLTMYIEENDYKDGVVQFLGLKFENGDIKQQKIQKLRLIEPETDELEVPDVTFSSILNLPSSDFQKIIRDLSCISDKLEIKSVGNELIFKCFRKIIFIYPGQQIKSFIRRRKILLILFSCQNNIISYFFQFCDSAF